MRQPVRYWWRGLALAGTLSAGCREELGPQPLQTTRVSGRVLAGGVPIREGWIEFGPAEGTVGDVCSAPIRGDGTFEADRVAVGRDTIGIVGAPLEPALRSLFHPFRTPIRRRIAEGAHDPLTIDLLEEAIRYQKSRPPRS